MGNLPDYVGVSALGLKMGIIIPGSDVPKLVLEALAKCERDGLLDDGDTVCITESVVARAQNNFVSVEDIAHDLVAKTGIRKDGKLGVVFPILSRNRFSLILQGFAKAVQEGHVIVQLSYPNDEVGNQLIDSDLAEALQKKYEDEITLAEIGQATFQHPITGVNYIDFYKQIVTAEGAQAEIVLCNDPLKIKTYQPDVIVVANIHERQHTLAKLKGNKADQIITLQDLCNDLAAPAGSEYGLLGSNMSSNNKLKLAPRNADQIANQIQDMVAETLQRQVEVIVYGDGAYCDPTTRIYELADPKPAFGLTSGLRGKYREGFKYKLVVDNMYAEGINLADMESQLAQRKRGVGQRDSMETEGTTPRKAEDLIASLADLISGSADAGTPLVLIKGFLV